MMSIRKQNDENKSPPDADAPAGKSHLPARRPQATALLEAPRKGLKVVVETGANAYFSACRRIARLLNGQR